jgi:hypothetical protein
MTFDHGTTEIIVSRRKEEPEKKCEHFVNNEGMQRKIRVQCSTTTP